MLFFTDGIFFFYANSKPNDYTDSENWQFASIDNAGKTDKNKKTTK